MLEGELGPPPFEPVRRGAVMTEVGRTPTRGRCWRA